MFLPQVAFWEYMQIPPRLHRSVLVLDDALSLYASLYLIRQEIIDVTSSSLHTGHPRPGIGPISGPMVLRVGRKYMPRMSIEHTRTD